jgi:hypothetical protein
MIRRIKIDVIDANNLDKRLINFFESYEFRKTSQRFGKIKRAATQRTKPTLCSTFAFAPTAPTKFDQHYYGKP